MSLLGLERNCKIVGAMAANIKNCTLKKDNFSKCKHIVSFAASMVQFMKVGGEVGKKKFYIIYLYYIIYYIAYIRYIKAA